MGTASNAQRARRFRLLLAFLTADQLILLIYFIRQDTRPLTYDDAWYLEYSFHLYHRLREGGLTEFFAAYKETQGIRPPMIAVLPIPFYWLFGADVDSALWMNALFLVISNVYLFRLVEDWHGPATALLAVVIFQTMPVTIGMSRAFMTEFGLVAFIIVFIYYLAQSNHFRSVVSNLKLGIVGGLGMLMKISFLLVAAPILVTMICRKLRNSPEESLAGHRPVLKWFAKHPLWTIGGTASLVAGTWYAFHLASVVEFTLQYSVGSIGHYQAASGGIWLRDAAQIAVSTYYTAAVFLLGGFATGYLARRAKLRSRDAPPNPGARGRGKTLIGGSTDHPVNRSTERTMILLSWFLPGAVAAYFGRHQDVRYLLPVLPPVAIFLAVSLNSVCDWVQASRRTRALAAVAFCLFPLYCHAALTFPLPGLPETLQVGRVVIFRRHLGWARPPDQYGNWGQDRIVAAARELSAGAAEPVNVIVGVEHPFFNANVLGYLNARDNGKLRFHSLGFDPDTPVDVALRNALERIRGLNPSVIVMAEGFEPRELQGFINRLNGYITDRLAKDQLPFQRAAEIQLTPTVKAVLFRRKI